MVISYLKYDQDIASLFQPVEYSRVLTSGLGYCTKIFGQTTNYLFCLRPAIIVIIVVLPVNRMWNGLFSRRIL
jgi:hypothetical protein